jgi:general L-amino acid transport system permease protein
MAMAAPNSSLAYVRNDEAPRLPPPPSTVGLQGWLRKNLFSSIGDSIVTVVFGLLAVWIVWQAVEFAVLQAVWTGENRNACTGENIGACWPMVVAKFPQWIYGFFPVDERWRVNICFLVGAAALIPMLMPSAPYKVWNALFLLIVFPLLALILLTGGNFAFNLGSYVKLASFMALVASAIPLIVFGVEDGIARNKLGLALAGLGLVLWLASFAVDIPFGGLPVAVLFAGAAVLSIVPALTGSQQASMPMLKGWGAVLAGLLIAMLVLDTDFGLVPVETPQWGGLMLTLVVSITGIVASLPLGIILALGRRSQMPIVKTLCITFIEVIRGVPLLTVLFMASVMLPLFLPPGTSFDKLLRALIGVALFSSAYMAEVVRGGLQAIGKGQYEGAQALGLSYWQTMAKIILPQALKISIPNIVGNFISLFQDTTLVLIIGLFDLLGIVQAGLRDANWASASSAPTGYFAVALMFWVFCFGMSRYSIFTERRLATGHKR